MSWIYVHDVRLVYGCDPATALRLSVVEGVAGDTLRGVPSNELDGLDDTVHNLKRRSVTHARDR